jgi:hypothetical protein
MCDARARVCVCARVLCCAVGASEERPDAATTAATAANATLSKASLASLADR